jgi:hypothetical protein
VQHLKPLRPEFAVSPLVATRLRRLRVNAALEFNDQPQFEATKIHDALLDRLLAAAGIRVPGSQT